MKSPLPLVHIGLDGPHAGVVDPDGKGGGDQDGRQRASVELGGPRVGFGGSSVSERLRLIA